jgi:hypothetical protein
MTDTQTTQSTEVAVLSPKAAALLDDLNIRFADTNDIQWAIAEKLAYATSLDDLLTNDGPQGLREHMHESFMIRNVQYLPSSFPGSPVYAIIDAVTPDGEPVMYTTGALSVIIQLAKGMQMGWYDGELVKAAYASDEATADGNRPYMLKRA